MHEKRRIRLLNIVVCVKPVEIKGERRKMSLSEYDETALETAFMIRDEVGNGKIMVISMRPKSDDMKACLKNTVTLGADEAILLSDGAFGGADTLATGYTLSMAIKKIDSFDLIICGKQSFDSNTGQVGASIAERLGIPHLTNITSIEDICDEYIECTRKIDTDIFKMRISLPAVITTDIGLKLRDRTMPRILETAQYSVKVWNSSHIGADTSKCGHEGSPTDVIASENQELLPRGKVIEGSLDDKATKFADEIHFLTVPTYS
jgi:electron transfer flavoprotein beta subunit